MNIKVMHVRLRSLLLAMIPIALICALASATGRGRTKANESACHDHLIWLAYHLREYRDANGHYPPAITRGRGAKSFHSWRTLLHNHIEAWSWKIDFGHKYDLEQPWNTAGNLAAATPAASEFVCHNNQGDPPRYTNYVAVTDRGVSSLERADALAKGSPEEARQILLIEYPDSDIFWTEPRDLDIDDLSKLTEGADPGIGVLFANARFRRVTLAELRKLLGR